MRKKIKLPARIILLFLTSFLVLSCNPLLNFGIVKEGKIFRSGQPDKDDFRYIAKELKIKTLIVFKKDVASFERNYAARFGIKLFHLNMSASTPPTDEQLEQYFGILYNQGSYPLWMHCQGGADRTGIMTALYRIEFEHWKKWDAILEMLTYFHIPLRYPKLTQYIYHYKRRYGKYRETDKEMEELKKFLKEKDLDPDSEPQERS